MRPRCGTGLALGLLALLVLIFGPLLGLIPIDLMQFIIGTLLILFGLRWLRKAILRASGFIALHDEEKAFAAETDSLRRQSAERRARGLEVGNLRGTVAVIDDDASLRRSVVRRLNAYGFPAIEYASAEALLNRDPEAAIDCLVLDIDLGGMSGIELQRSLKGAGLNLPVIFITALEDSQLKTEAERAGCIAYLRKPFAGSVLIVCELMARRHSRGNCSKASVRCWREAALEPSLDVRGGGIIHA